MFRKAPVAAETGGEASQQQALGNSKEFVYHTNSDVSESPGIEASEPGSKSTYGKDEFQRHRKD
jgi:hypothetical protein